MNKKFNTAGFTLAEVLIALGIIGIVAAITLPRLIANINEKQYETGRQKALSIIGEAGKRIVANGEMNSNYNAQEFIDNTLKKYLAITKTCAPRKFHECGWSEVVKSKNGTSLSWVKNDLSTAANMGMGSASYNVPPTTISNNSNYLRAFATSNGYSFVLFYNPGCDKSFPTGGFHQSGNKICMHTIYDMNGKKGPNQYGKDIGIVTVYNPDETVTAVAPYFDDEVSEVSNYYNAETFCANKKHGYHVPTLDEYISGIASLKFTNLDSNRVTQFYWTSTKWSNTHQIIISRFYSMEFSREKGSNSEQVICAKN